MYNSKSKDYTMQKIDSIISTAHEKRASDIHITAGIPVRMRVDGALYDMNSEPLTGDDCTCLAHEISSRTSEISSMGEIDVSYTSADGVRCRVNIYRERRYTAIAIRLLNKGIPGYDELGLPLVAREFTKYKRGIVLVTGQTGSGKSTTLACLVNDINQHSAKHIVTLEDPIEYVHRSEKGTVHQREVGIDTASFAHGLASVLREDPDVVMVGELRRLNEIEAALTLAETGHLVLASVHTNSAADTIDRIVDVFPANQQAQIRVQLSMTLNAVLCQQLIPALHGKGRVLATEVMMMNGAIRNLIREGKTPQIENSIATSADIGSHLMDNSIAALYKKGRISRDDALVYAHNPDYLLKLIR
ncbi:MAG: PilT/PilU family type 4a pilus ATPase [Clostridia bacterium]|nr:PilT/PilU family type 4a pilus ATPase [Clostridia bacterium]